MPITGAGEQGRVSRKREAPATAQDGLRRQRAKGWPQKAAGKSHMRWKEVRQRDLGKTAEPSQSEVQSVVCGRDAAHGEGERRTFKSLVPRSWCTHREKGLEGEETEPVTAQASPRLLRMLLQGMRDAL